MPENGGVPDDSKQIVESNYGKIWTAITDQNGKFKIGDFFEVDQRKGFINFSAGSYAFDVVTDSTPELGGQLDALNNKIVNLGTPTDSADAATKAYVDAAVVTELSSDTSPQLGGNLDVNGNEITSASNGNVVINPDGTGIIELGSNVGIGTPSPGKKLDIEGAPAELKLNSTNSVYSRFTHAHNGTPLWTTGTRTSDDYTIFRESGTGNVLIPSGNVGIGTYSPSTRLHVSGGAFRIDGAQQARFYNLTSTELAYVSAEAVSNTNPALVFGTSNLERARIDSAGRLLVGTPTADSVGGDSNLGFYLRSDSYSKLVCVRANSDTAGGELRLGKTKASGSGSALVSNDDNIGRIRFCAGDGTDLNSETARIQAFVDGTPGANDMPGRLTFSTTADGASSPTERVRISANGVLTVKNGAVAEIDTLTSAATVTPDFAASCNFTLTLDQNLTIANPSNLVAGQTGSIFLVQDATGSRTAAWGSYWDFAGGTAPVLTTTASAVDRVDYVVRTTGSIHAVATLNYS